MSVTAFLTAAKTLPALRSVPDAAGDIVVGVDAPVDIVDAGDDGVDGVGRAEGVVVHRVVGVDHIGHILAVHRPVDIVGEVEFHPVAVQIDDVPDVFVVLVQAHGGDAQRAEHDAVDGGEVGADAGFGFPHTVLARVVLVDGGAGRVVQGGHLVLVVGEVGGHPIVDDDGLLGVGHILRGQLLGETDPAAIITAVLVAVVGGDGIGPAGVAVIQAVLRGNPGLGQQAVNGVLAVVPTADVVAGFIGSLAGVEIVAVLVDADGGDGAVIPCCFEDIGACEGALGLDAVDFALADAKVAHVADDVATAVVRAADGHGRGLHVQVGIVVPSDVQAFVVDGVHADTVVDVVGQRRTVQAHAHVTVVVEVVVHADVLHGENAVAVDVVHAQEGVFGGGGGGLGVEGGAVGGGLRGRGLHDGGVGDAGGLGMVHGVESGHYLDDEENTQHEADCPADALGALMGEIVK